MSRFITHILDVKNVLGMNRLVPYPPYPANELILRVAASGDVYYTLIYTGDITVSAMGDSETYSDAYSGTEIGIAGVSVNTEIVITGNINQIGLLNSANVGFLVLSNTIETFSVTANIRTIDMRNASAVIAFAIDEDNVNQLYAIANTVQQKNICRNLINNSSVNNGVLWIDSTQAYAADVITAATAKGWTVKSL